MNKTEASRKIVLGLGNTLNRDEGLGVHAVKALEARLGSAGVQLEFLDGGVLGLNLLPWVEECSHLLVLDAINARKEPGTLIEMKRDEIPLYSGIKLSDHQVTFQEVLGLANFRGHLPEHLHLIGIQPADLTIGVELSPLIMATVPQVLERATAILQEWNLVDKEIDKMKKIAFPTDDGETISRHMGQAQFFLVATVDEAGALAFEKRDKPHHDASSESGQHEHTGHGMGPAMFAPIADCQVLISGGMGEPAYQFAQAQGLEVFLPAEKNIRKAIEAFRSGSMESDLRRIHKH
jgi:hydrogenase maturation protease